MLLKDIILILSIIITQIQHCCQCILPTQFRQLTRSEKAQSDMTGEGMTIENPPETVLVSGGIDIMILCCADVGFLTVRWSGSTAEHSIIITAAS